MSIRKRVRVKTPAIVSSGQTSPTVADVKWGPSFGGVDGDKLDAVGTIGLDKIGLLYSIDGSHTIDLEKLALNGGLDGNGLVDLEKLGLNGNIDMDGSFASLQYKTTQIIATKDSYVPTTQVVGCNDDGNKDGQDLRVGAVVVVENEPAIYIGWDLTAFPNNATVTEALLTIKPNTEPVLNPQTYNIREIAAGGEGWDETTIICSNAPAPTGGNQSFVQPLNTNEITLDITATFANYIAGRMGSANTCTFVINQDEALLQEVTVYESKDEGTNDAQGPRLELTFTVPV